MRTEYGIKVITYFDDPERDALFRNIMRAKLRELLSMAAILSTGGRMASVETHQRGIAGNIGLDITTDEDIEAGQRDELAELFPELFDPNYTR